MKYHFQKIYLTAVILLGLSAIAALPTAAIFVEPSNSPPGGRSATFIDTSAQTQQKLGSLIIGSKTNPKQLCLNGTNCLSNWGDAAGFIGGPFVKVFTNDNEVIPARQIGYAHLIGDGSTAATFQSDAGRIGPLKIGIYAWDHGDPTSYAAYFAGRVDIQEHNNVTNDKGRLCLNGIADYDRDDPAPQYSCLEDWADLPGGSVSAYIKVQATNPPSDLQVGSAWLGNEDNPRPGAWQFESVVVGGVVPGAASYCGDGLCSPEIGEDKFICPHDCPL